MDTNPLPLVDKALAASVTASGLPPIIDGAACAQLLSCSKEHVNTLADRGELPATKYGRGWVFVTVQVLAHVAMRCAQNVAQRDARTLGKLGSEEPSHTAAAPQEAAAKSLRTAGHVLVQPRARRRGRPRMPVPA